MVPPGTEPSLNGPRSPRLQRARDGSRFGLNTGNIRDTSGSRSEPASSRPADSPPYIDLKTGKRYSHPATSSQTNSEAPNKGSRPKPNPEFGSGNPSRHQSVPAIDPDLLSIKPPAKSTPRTSKTIVSMAPTSVPQQSQTPGRAIDVGHEVDDTQLQSTDIDDYDDKTPGSDEFEGRDFFDDREEFGHYKYDPRKDPDAELDGMIIGTLIQPSKISTQLMPNL